MMPSRYFSQHGIGAVLQRIGGALDELVDVGIVEVDPFEAAVHQPSRSGEVTDAAGLFTHF